MLTKILKAYGLAAVVVSTLAVVFAILLLVGKPPLLIQIVDDASALATLITGVLAIIGAGIAAWAVFRSTNAQLQHNRESDARALAESQKIAAMKVAGQLRLHLNWCISSVDDVQNHISSGGQIGTWCPDLQPFPFESHLNDVAGLAPEFAGNVFALINRRIDHQAFFDFTLNLGDFEDEREEIWLNSIADLWMHGRAIEDALRRFVGWAPVEDGDRREEMQKLIDEHQRNSRWRAAQSAELFNSVDLDDKPTT